jgi:hypothetical protein
LSPGKPDSTEWIPKPVTLNHQFLQGGERGVYEWEGWVEAERMERRELKAMATVELRVCCDVHQRHMLEVRRLSADELKEIVGNLDRAEIETPQLMSETVKDRRNKLWRTAVESEVE